MPSTHPRAALQQPLLVHARGRLELEPARAQQVLVLAPVAVAEGREALDGEVLVGTRLLGQGPAIFGVFKSIYFHFPLTW
jgi:hypothetical protein